MVGFITEIQELFVLLFFSLLFQYFMSMFVSNYWNNLIWALFNELINVKNAFNLLQFE